MLADSKLYFFILHITKNMYQLLNVAVVHKTKTFKKFKVLTSAFWDLLLKESFNRFTKFLSNNRIT